MTTSGSLLVLRGIERRSKEAAGSLLFEPVAKGLAPALRIANESWAQKAVEAARSRGGGKLETALIAGLAAGLPVAAAALFSEQNEREKESEMLDQLSRLTGEPKEALLEKFVARQAVRQTKSDVMRFLDPRNSPVVQKIRSVVAPTNAERIARSSSTQKVYKTLAREEEAKAVAGAIRENYPEALKRQILGTVDGVKKKQVPKWLQTSLIGAAAGTPVAAALYAGRAKPDVQVTEVKRSSAPEEVLRLIDSFRQVKQADHQARQAMTDYQELWGRAKDRLAKEGREVLTVGEITDLVRGYCKVSSLMGTELHPNDVLDQITSARLDKLAIDPITLGIGALGILGAGTAAVATKRFVKAVPTFVRGGTKGLGRRKAVMGKRYSRQQVSATPGVERRKRLGGKEEPAAEGMSFGDKMLLGGGAGGLAALTVGRRKEPGIQITKV